MSGVVLGTAAYVSPEQARGADLDERTDIWAFGVILFEMLTGRRPFDGDSVPEILAKVLEHEPDLDLVPATTTPSVRRLIRRCLQKDVGRRLHHVADVRLEIEDSLNENGLDPSQPSGTAQPSPPSLVRAIIRPFFNVSRISVAVLLLPLVFAAVGYLTSFVFNRALRIRSTEGLFDYFAFGYRAMIAPAVLVLLAAVALILVVSVLGLLTWLGSLVWPTNPLLRAERTFVGLATRWLADKDPRASGQAFFVLSGLALVFFAAVAWRLLSVIVQLIVNGPAAGVDTSILSQSERPYHLLVGNVGVVLLLGLFTIWLWLFSWLQQRGADPWMLRVFRLRSLAAILAILLLFTAPWRLVWNNMREPVSFEGQSAFVLTEDASRVVIYVPGEMPLETTPDDPKLVRPNRASRQSIFPD